MPGRRRSSRHGSQHRAYTRPDGDVTEMRRVAAVVIARWDGWAAGAGQLSVTYRGVADQMEALRVGLADPDVDRFCAAVTGLLGGVPVSDVLPDVRAAVEQLRRTTFPVHTDARLVGGCLFDAPTREG